MKFSQQKQVAGDAPGVGFRLSVGKGTNEPSGEIKIFVLRNKKATSIIKRSCFFVFLFSKKFAGFTPEVNNFAFESRIIYV